ncbi:zinc finger protein [Botryosphaeria dothidea]|uniref:Zinc finger protein n=1 Tax=Botryosphaeria dothidea TaxID=55169 RepID=A0A8H4J4Y1_9PEZI|nr:zinc finger protein [Botryosphaeria dothidea]
MAGPSLPPTPRFQKCLDDFKKNLSSEQEETFKFTTLEELKRLVHEIQEEQNKSRRMNNLKRLAPFIEAMEQFDQVVQVFLNAADMLAFIWGPVKFLLLSTRTYYDAFNLLLDAYMDIGESIPLFAQYEHVLNDKSQMHVVLEYVYTDVMDFHSSAIRYFKSPVWKQMLHATWKTFRSKFEPSLSNLRRHKALLEAQANLLYLQQYQLDRQRTEVEFRNIEQQAEQNRKLGITSWLSPANVETDHKAAALARCENPTSCQWILEQNPIKRWLDPKYPLQPVLWVNGQPGAGKTVLASFIIDECRKRNNGNVLFFYSKYGDEKRNSLLAILRGMLAQALRLEPLLVPCVFDEAAKDGHNTLDDLETAKNLTQVVLATFDSVWLVVDGLDECPKQAKRPITTFFRSFVDSSNQQAPGKFRCSFFSQDDNDIGELLKGVPTFTITGVHNIGDIRSFCQLKAQTIQQEFEYPEEKSKRMAEKISSTADGMFIYAVLILSYLEEQTTLIQLEQEIEDMPLNLDGIYERIIQRVLYDAGPAERIAARRLLGWLLKSIRPLKWHEIQGAAAYNPSKHSFDLQGGKLRKGAKRLCGSLVKVYEDGEIRLVHLSAKMMKGQDEELELLSLCLNYLRLPAFDQDLDQESAKKFVLDGHYAFMDYALASWTVHLDNILQNSPQGQNKTSKRLTSTLQAFFQAHPIPSDKIRMDKSISERLRRLRKEDFFIQLVQIMQTASDVNYEDTSEQCVQTSGGHRSFGARGYNVTISTKASPMHKSDTSTVMSISDPTDAATLVVSSLCLVTQQNNSYGGTR